jgi:LytS/YehU family sensor histidine kinase
MTLENKKEATTAIVQLSDILRYVIYDTNTERVQLNQELSLLHNYIAFQNHRSTGSKLVNFTTEVEDENFKIYPMLLLPLVENSFKYGFADHSEQEKIQIELHQQKGQFLFKITNKNLVYKANLDDNYSGFGLKNLQHNLNLVYPQKHQLTVDRSKEVFSVTLSITDEEQ